MKKDTLYTHALKNNKYAWGKPFKQKLQNAKHRIKNCCDMCQYNTQVHDLDILLTVSSCKNLNSARALAKFTHKA